MEVNINLGALLIAYFLESLLLSYVGLGLLGIKINDIGYFKLATIYTINVIMFKDILNLYGIHTLFIFVILLITYKLMLKIKIRFAIMSILLGFIILAIGESIFYPIFINYFQVSMKVINQNTELFIFLYALCKIPLIVISSLIYFFDLNLINIDKNALDY